MVGFAALNEAFAAADSIDAVTDVLASEAARLGFQHVACCDHVDPLTPPPRAVMMTNYPQAWIERFSQRHYVRICPVMRLASAQLTPFLWSDDRFLATLHASQRRVMAEAAEFGLTEGATFPIHDGRWVHGSCSVIVEAGGVDHGRLQRVQALALFAYEKAVHCRRPPGPNAPGLSARERQCLRLAALGCKDFAIARALGIAEGTVHNIFRNILRKYGAASRTQALFIAIQAGEISPNDF